MIPKAMDSFDLVEAVMLIEEVFGTEIPDNDAEHFGGPRGKTFRSDKYRTKPAVREESC